MKGLGKIPTLQELGAAYRVLQSEPERIAAEDLALWSQWARFDPRLGEQWVAHVMRFWKTLRPTELSQALLAQPWPAAAGVLLDQTRMLLGTAEKRPFRGWQDCVMSGIGRAAQEQYFIGLRAFAGEEMRQDVLGSLKSYRRWGYFGREILSNKALSRSGQSTWVSAAVRRQALSNLLATRDRIRTQDYIDALGGAISRRQAQLDLSHFPGLQARGRTQGRCYVKLAGRPRRKRA